jgi:ABC-2 type transport system permease protein
MTVVALVSGMYFPIALLPGWLQWVSEIQPFTPTVELMRWVLIGFPMTGSPAIALAKLIGFIVVGMPIALMALAKAGRYGRKRGTIIEY